MRAPAILALVSVLSAAGWVPAPATGQDLAPVRAFRSFTRGSSATGLPASTVVSLLCDREGTIWVATFDGLAKIEHGTADRLPTPASPQSPVPASGPTLRLVVRRAGGIYVWESRDDADRVYTQEWRRMVTEKYGSPPTIEYLHSPVMVDNRDGTISVAA